MEDKTSSSSVVPFEVEDQGRRLGNTSLPGTADAGGPWRKALGPARIKELRSLWDLKAKQEESEAVRLNKAVVQGGIDQAAGDPHYGGRMQGTRRRSTAGGGKDGSVGGGTADRSGCDCGASRGE